ncbi:ATP-dependent DNA helicase [Aureococcus anophagefferens]|nr:ATP-dependent DNA helicase [Aureococcus anophagefferens]
MDKPQWPSMRGNGAAKPAARAPKKAAAPKPVLRFTNISAASTEAAAAPRGAALMPRGAAPMPSNAAKSPPWQAPRGQPATLPHNAPRADRKPPGWTESLSAPRAGQVARRPVEAVKAPAPTRAAVIGSREHLCGHSVVKRLRGTAQNKACRALCAARGCSLRNELDKQLKARKGEDFGDVALDIEELVDDGKRRGTCAYFGARANLKDADLVFAPYNYVLDERHRATSGIDWRGTIVVLDEAHNVASVAEDAASFELTAADVGGAARELDHCVDALGRMQLKASLDAKDGGLDAELPSEEGLLQLKRVVLGLEDALGRVACPTKDPEGGAAYLEDRGGRLHELVLHPAGLTCAAAAEWFASGLRGAADVLAGDGDEASKNASAKLELLERATRLAFRGQLSVPGADAPPAGGDDAKELGDAYYRVHVSEGGGDAPAALCYWCFSPGLAVSELLALGARSLLFASGTLSPLPSFAAELGLRKPAVLENPHVIDAATQLYAAVVGVAPPTSAPSSRAAAAVPRGGVLVFFPSYGAMDDALSAWKRTGVLDDIERRSGKVVLSEPRKAADMKAVIRSFDAAAAPGAPGALLLAVCRGKVSEGMDFADDRCRCVVVTGLPYAPAKDRKVRGKRSFLDDKKRQNRDGLSGGAWYDQQAARAVNQALGRAIRHRGDFGAVLLCDERFASPGKRSMLSKWIDDSLQTPATFQEAEDGLRAFFRGNGLGGGGAVAEAKREAKSAFFMSRTRDDAKRGRSPPAPRADDANAERRKALFAARRGGAAAPAPAPRAAVRRGAARAPAPPPRVAAPKLFNSGQGLRVASSSGAVSARDGAAGVAFPTARALAPRRPAAAAAVLDARATAAAAPFLAAVRAGSRSKAGAVLARFLKLGDVGDYGRRAAAAELLATWKEKKVGGSKRARVLLGYTK